MKAEILAVILAVICFIAWAWRLNLDINWVNCLTTLLAAGLGSWTAYLLNLRQQDIYDRKRKEEEKEKEQERKEAEANADRALCISRLNYLKTYLYFYIDELQKIYDKLNYKQQLYEGIKKSNYKTTEQEEDALFIFHIDFSSTMKIDWSTLSFANNEAEFIYSLSHVETAIHRFVHSHDFAILRFEKDVEKFKTDMDKEKEISVRLYLIKKFIDTQIYNNDSEIFRLQQAIFCIDRMISVLSKYARTHKYNLNNLSYLPEQIKFVAKAIKDVKKEQNN